MKVIHSAFLFLALTTGLRAAPVLLGSHDAFTRGGTAPQSDPRIQFILELPFFPLTAGQGVGEGVFFHDDELRIEYFNAANDEAFAEFAQSATNGQEDNFVLWSLFPSGGGDGHPGTESELFGMAPDLSGYSLDYIKLIVFDVRLEPWIPDPEVKPEITGYRFEAFLRYELVRRCLNRERWYFSELVFSFLSQDLAGGMRRINGVVDMGAYESPPQPN